MEIDRNGLIERLVQVVISLPGRCCLMLHARIVSRTYKISSPQTGANEMAGATHRRNAESHKENRETDRDNKGALFHFIELIFQRKLNSRDKLVGGHAARAFTATRQCENLVHTFTVT